MKILKISLAVTLLFFASGCTSMLVGGLVSGTAGAGANFTAWQVLLEAKKSVNKPLAQVTPSLQKALLENSFQILQMDQGAHTARIIAISYGGEVPLVALADLLAETATATLISFSIKEENGLLQHHPLAHQIMSKVEYSLKAEMEVETVEQTIAQSQTVENPINRVLDFSPNAALDGMCQALVVTDFKIRSWQNIINGWQLIASHRDDASLILEATASLLARDQTELRLMVRREGQTPQAGDFSLSQRVLTQIKEWLTRPIAPAALKSTENISLFAPKNTLAAVLWRYGFRQEKGDEGLRVARGEDSIEIKLTKINNTNIQATMESHGRLQQEDLHKILIEARERAH